MKSIEELVAQVKQSTYPDWNVDIDRYLLEFATRFLAAYAEQQEPVGWIDGEGDPYCQHGWGKKPPEGWTTCEENSYPVFRHAAPVVPADMVLVPREPTEAMIRASWDCAGLTSPDDGQRKYIAIAWHAMIAAGGKS